MTEKKDHIEDFFGKHLSKGQFEFDEAQWADLENKLDVLDSTAVSDSSLEKGYHSIIQWGSILLIITLFFTKYHLDSVSTSQIVEKQNLMIDSLESELKALEIQKQNSNQERQQNLSDKTEQQTSFAIAPFNETKPANKEYENEQTANGSLVALSSSVVSTNENGREAKKVAIRAATDQPEDSANNRDSRNLQNEETTYFENEEPDDYPEPGELVDSQNLILEIESKDFVDFPLEPNDFVIGGFTPTDTSEAIQEKADKSGYWILNGFAAPDFNSTNFSELFNSLGQSVGVSVAYVLNEKIRFSGGVVLNNKKYSAGPGEYTPTYGFWTSSSTPESTDATCLALGIPVTFGYRIINNSKSKVFINLGTSTYWMLTETYQFNYDHNYPGLRTVWKGKRENFHLFGTFDTSILYQRTLSNKLSLVIEPYFKNPLKGIGEGSVNLLNSGVNVGVSYRLQKAKHPPDG